eukprot:g1310.t1
MLSPSTNDNSIVTPLRGTFEVGQRVVRNVPVENVLPSSPSEFLRTPEMERAVGTVIETDEAAVLVKWEVGESHADEWVFKEELEPETVFAPAVENHDEVVYDETFGAIAKEVLDSWDVRDDGGVEVIDEGSPTHALPPPRNSLLAPRVSASAAKEEQSEEEVGKEHLKKKKSKKKKSKKKKKNKRKTATEELPRSILTPQPKKRVSRKINFGSVSVRKFKRSLAGGGGVPHDGGWCLGLGDRASASDEECDIDDYESSRLSELKEREARLPTKIRQASTGETRQFSHRGGENPLFRKLSQSQRKKILKKWAAAQESPSEKGTDHEGHLKRELAKANVADCAELEVLRSSRKSGCQGCDCSLASLRKVDVSLLKSLLNKRGIAYVENDSHHAILSAYIENVVNVEGLCTDEEICNCAAAGIPCHDVSCACCDEDARAFGSGEDGVRRTRRTPKKAALPRIMKGCGNVHGAQVFSAKVVDEYRRKILAGI